MISEYKISSLGDTKLLAEKLSPLLKGKTVFLNGSLGAGKTTFVSFISACLGAIDQSSSPTFSIANTYSTKDIPVIHIDLYRLETEDDLEMTGFWEIIREKATIFIEWAGKFRLNEYINNYTEIKIEKDDGGARKFIVNMPWKD